jgi:hypothetical protein
MAFIELFSVWGPPALQIVALIVLKGRWRIAAWLGMLLWGLGWLTVWYMNLTGFVAIIYYLILMAAFAVTRATSGGDPPAVSKSDGA